MLSAEIVSAVLAATNDGVVVAEIAASTTSVVFSNAAFEAMAGWSSQELLRQNCSLIVEGSPDEEQQQIFLDALQQKNPCQIKLRLQTKEKRLIWVELRTEFQADYLIMVLKDITQDEYVKSVLDKVNVLYREMSKRLEYTNETDHLTRLKNRGHLCTRGEFMLGAAKREKLRSHALLIDVDSFRILNTLGGPTLGDECLVRIAEVIRNYFCRATDIAIRMGDDEFAIICIEDDDQRIHDRAHALQRDVKALQIKDFSGREHELSVSIGIYSVTPEKSTTIEDMIHNAGQLIFSTQSAGNQIVHSKTGDSIRPLRH